MEQELNPMQLREDTCSCLDDVRNTQLAWHLSHVTSNHVKQCKQPARCFSGITSAILFSKDCQTCSRAMRQ